MEQSRRPTSKRLTAGRDSISVTDPIAPFPMAIFVKFTGGSGVEKIVFVIYGCSGHLESAADPKQEDGNVTM